MSHPSNINDQRVTAGRILQLKFHVYTQETNVFGQRGQLYCQSSLVTCSKEAFYGAVLKLDLNCTSRHEQSHNQQKTKSCAVRTPQFTSLQKSRGLLSLTFTESAAGEIGLLWLNLTEQQMMCEQFRSTDCMNDNTIVLQPQNGWGWRF